MSKDRAKRRKLEKEITEKKQWSQADIELDLFYEKDGKEISETLKFSIVHNLPNIPSLRLEDAIENWKVRTELHTDKSLCDYINSKTYMTGCTALTMNEYGELCRVKGEPD